MARLPVRNLATRICGLPSSVPEPEQYRRDPILDIGSRWEPCLHLCEAGLPYKVWTSHDVFKYHGLYRYRGVFSDPYDFQVLDLGLLVNDIEEAATILEGAGYFRTSIPNAEQEGMCYHSGNGRGCIRLLNTSAIVQEYSRRETFEQVTARISLAAGVKDTYVIDNKWSMQGLGNGVLLMLASDWNYALPSQMKSPIFYQVMLELSEYFNSHSSLWMDVSISFPVTTISFSDHARFWHHANIINNLIFEADVAWTVEIEKSVKKENRQTLFDLLETHYSG